VNGLDEWPYVLTHTLHLGIAEGTMEVGDIIMKAKFSICT
jgi:hypothetical protein